MLVRRCRAGKRIALPDRLPLGRPGDLLLMVIVLVLFGGAVARGLFHDLTWGGVITGAAVIFLLRPVFGLLGLLGAKMPWHERFAQSFFGIRGIGSFYYLAYALNQADFPESAALWSEVGFVVLLSIVVHGISAPVAIETLDTERQETERQEHEKAEESVGRA